MSRSRTAVGLFACALVACGPGDNTADVVGGGDSRQADAAGEVLGVQDVVRGGDAGTDATVDSARSDVPPVDAPATDAPASDVPAIDGGGADATATDDVATDVVAEDVRPVCTGDGGFSDAGLSTDGTGERGQVHFHYESGNFFVTYPWRPMLSGTLEDIDTSSIVSDELFTIDTENPCIAEVVESFGTQVCCIPGDTTPDCSSHAFVSAQDCTSSGGYTQASYVFRIHANEVGDTRASLRHPDGTVYDSILLSVRESSRIEVYLADNDPPMLITSLTIPWGQSHALHALVYDGNGSQLQARHGITVTVGNHAIAGVRQAGRPFDSFDTMVDGFDVEMGTFGAGMTTIEFASKNASETLPLTLQ